METEVPEEKLREFFNKLTAKSGGKLSLEGFLKLNYELYLNRTEKEAKKQFSRLDKDESDSLDFEEVKTLLRENWVLLPERRKELRAQLDKFSEDEYLDMDLLSNILTKFGSDPIDEDNVSTFISDLDWNADGRISKDELTIFLLKGHEWDSGNRMDNMDGENLDETSDIEAETDPRVKNENSDEEDQGSQDEEQSMDQTDKMPRETDTPNKDKSKNGNESSDSDESSQEELSNDEEEEEKEEEDSRAEKTPDDDKATRKAKKEAKREAKKEARRAKKAAKKAKKDELASNKSADDPVEEEKEA